MKEHLRQAKLKLFGERLTEAVQALHQPLSQFDLSIEWGLGQNTLAYLMRGQRFPSIETLFTVAEKAGVSPGWLLGLPESEPDALRTIYPLKTLYLEDK